MAEELKNEELNEATTSESTEREEQFSEESEPRQQREEAAAEGAEETTASETDRPAEESEEPGEEAEEAQKTPAAVAVPASSQPHHRVQAARQRVEEAEKELEACIMSIQKDLDQFEEYERERLIPVVKESQRLLESLGMEEPPAEPGIPKVELESPEREKLRIRELSSGRGGAFFWGLVAALVTVGGWYLFAAKKMGAPLVPQKVPGMETLSALAGKVSLLFGPAEQPSVGAAVVIGSALVVWWLVYVILVSVRASKNRRIAEEIEEQAGAYCEKTRECQSTMDQIREHLKTLHQTVEKYEVLLDEKNAGVRRAIFIEEAGSFDDLHERSKEMAQEMDELLQELEKLLATPMAKSGLVTPEGVEALRQAKRIVNDHILRLYS